MAGLSALAPSISQARFRTNPNRRGAPRGEALFPSWHHVERQDPHSSCCRARLRAAGQARLAPEALSRHPLPEGNCAFKGRARKRRGCPRRWRIDFDTRSAGGNPLPPGRRSAVPAPRIRGTPPRCHLAFRRPHSVLRASHRLPNPLVSWFPKAHGTCRQH